MEVNMGILAWVLGSLAGLSGIMGIIVGTEAIPELADLPGPLNAMFWLTLGILLMLGCIACVNSRTDYE
jgi:zinc transporter ZupT